MLNKETFLRLCDVEKRIGMTKSWIYRMMNGGRFPEPIRLSPRAVRWRESEIELWIKAQCEPVIPVDSAAS